MRLIDKIRQMDENEFAEWLCMQIWKEYGRDPMMSKIRFIHVRNFLLMEVEHETQNT